MIVDKSLAFGSVHWFIVLVDWVKYRVDLSGIE